MKRISKAILAVLVLGAVACSAQLVERVKIVQGVSPQDIDNKATNTYGVCMKNYGHATWIVQLGALNNSAAFATGQVWQGTTVAMTTKKELPMKGYWVNTALGSIYTNTTQNYFSMAGTDDGKTYIIEADAADMDADNSYDCLRLDIGSPGNYSALISVLTILSEPRYTGSENAQPSPFDD